MKSRLSNLITSGISLPFLILILSLACPGFSGPCFSAQELSAATSGQTSDQKTDKLEDARQASRQDSSESAAKSQTKSDKEDTPSAIPQPAIPEVTPGVTPAPGSETPVPNVVIVKPKVGADYLGISGTADVARVAGASYPGVKITTLIEHGLADLAGIKVGDILLSLNSKIPHTDQEAQSILKLMPSGEIEMSWARIEGKKTDFLSKSVLYVNRGAIAKKILVGRPIADFETIAQVESNLLKLINADRQQWGANLAALDENPPLSTGARQFAQDMLDREYFSHIDPEGRGPKERARAQGIPTPTAENIMSGSITSQETETSFMDDPIDKEDSTRAHILDPTFTSVGIGACRKPNNTLIVVLLFGGRPVVETPQAKSKSKSRKGKKHAIKL